MGNDLKQEEIEQRQKEIEDKQKWLWRYRNAIFKANSLWRQAEEWQNLIYEPSCKVLDGMPQASGFSNNSDRKPIKHMELIEEATTATLLAKKIRKEITAAIEVLENSISVKILTLRYLEGLEWKEIRDIIHYSKTHTTKLHYAALIKLEIDNESSE